MSEKEKQTKKCPYCASDIEETLTVCPNCNEDIGKSWVITSILSNPYFGGIFGTYNFYVKRTKIAIIQLILSLTMYGVLITSLWCFFDNFMILFDKFKDGYGNKLSRKPTKTSTLLLLFIFLHRFYVKRPISGLLFMFTFGGFGIWWIIDLITILCGKFKNAEGQYIK